MGSTYRAERGVYLFPDLRSDPSRVQSLRLQAGILGGGELRVKPDPNTDIGSPSNLRRQEYWTMLSGATGQVTATRTRACWKRDGKNIWIRLARFSLAT